MLGQGLAPGSRRIKAVSIESAQLPGGGHFEVPVEELLRRARPLPPHEEMVIEDLSEDEGAAFLAALTD
jgi:hypothetical protein